jgi:ABC-type glycerol-3-phosphate transport system permease component
VPAPAVFLFPFLWMVLTSFKPSSTSWAIRSGSFPAP